MSIAVLRTWDETPQTTRNFKLETKLTDFGNLYSNKSIIGVGINLTQETSNSLSMLHVDYRRDRIVPWVHLAIFAPIISGGGNLSLRQMLSNPIKDIKQLQLRIFSPYISGVFGISDIELFYRDYRDLETSRFDEGA